MTYQELCENIGVERDTKNKARQLKNLRKEYEIIEVANGDYIINKKYNYIEKIEADTSNRKLRRYIEPLVCAMLQTNKDGVIEGSMPQLLVKFGFVNKDYTYAKYNPDEVDEYIRELEGVDVDEFEDYSITKANIFIEDSDAKLKRTLYDVLKDMNNKCLIKLDFIPTMCYREKATDGQIITSTKKIDELTQERYTHCQRKALDDNGVVNWSDIPFYKFKQIKQDIAKHFGCSYMFYTYHIVINRYDIGEVEKYLIEGNNRGHLRYSFNKFNGQRLKDNETILKELTPEEKDTYIEYLISTEKDYGLRYIKKQRKELEKE